MRVLFLTGIMMTLAFSCFLSKPSSAPFAYVYGLQSGQLHELFISEGYIAGLEFSYDCLDLYLSHQTEGIIQWRFGEEGFTEILDPEGFGKTHLEVGIDDYMYLVREGERAGELWQLRTSDNTFIPIGVEISVYSDGVAATADAYALPDQIDGEGDGAFYGVPPLEINGLAIPNPVLDNWVLEMEITTSGILKLEVFSQSGALLLKEERYAEPGPGLWQLNLGHLPAGAYWYRLHGPAIPPVSGKVIKL